MSDSPVALLRAHARHAPWNARGLAAHATALVDAAGFRPTNTSARAAPSARATATYGYRHLLQLLAIKIRQREGQTLEVIKKELAGVGGDMLERRVATALAPALAVGADEAARKTDADVPAEWRRMVVADGIELHVRRDLGASRDDALVAMREAVRAALGRSELRG